MRPVWVLILTAGCATTSTAPPEPAAPRPSSPIPPEVVDGATNEPEVDEFEVETSTDAEFALDLPLDEDDLEAGRGIGPILSVTGTVTFDIPRVSDHERVAFWRDYLSGRGRRYFEKWLARSTRYVPIFWDILDRYDLPRDLVFLAMVESGFSTSAYSWAHAAGPWQFMASTGRRYGLRIDFWIDERRDFEKATDAAARHLRDLYQAYGDWLLAFAAYNAGQGKVNRAIRRYGTQDFWELSRRRYLRRETKQYVPKILAAAEVAKQPDSYGFENVPYQTPWVWHTVTVTTATSLDAFTRACEEVDLEWMQKLNPALRASVTPPRERWEVRVPGTVTATCADKLQRVREFEPYVYRYHRLEEGDSLAALARRHHVSPEEVLQFNRIKPDQFYDFDEMVFPVPRARAHEVPIVNPPGLAFRPPVYGPQGVRLVRYRVRSGDSLWRIANRFQVGISELTRWNGLRSSSVLQVGQRMRIYLGSDRAVARAQKKSRTSLTASRSGSNGAKRSSVSRPEAKPAPAPVDSGRTHRVAPGESYWLIANRYGTSVQALVALNGLERSHVLQPGELLSIPAGQKTRDAASPPMGDGHRVRSGESLWIIARKYGLTVEELRRLNGLEGSSAPIQPGQVLRVK